jgi:predicted amidohydrolase
MIVAGLQMDLAWEDPEENFARAEDWSVRAIRAGARLLVLPEMYATGFSMDAEKVARFGDRARDFLAVLARRHEVWVIGGYAEPGPRRPRNACSVVDPAGVEALRYHKIHPFTHAGEHEHYDGGESLGTVEIEGVRVTPLVCYDLRFPEPFRVAAAETDLFVVIANWPEKRSETWRLLLRSRAVENQAYVLGVNRVGEGGGEPHAGDSALIDPLGRTRASASLDPALVLAPVDPQEVAEKRARFSALADRRPDVYAKLERDRGDP